MNSQRIRRQLGALLAGLLVAGSAFAQAPAVPADAQPAPAQAQPAEAQPAQAAGSAAPAPAPDPAPVVDAVGGGEVGGGNAQAAAGAGGDVFAALEQVQAAIGGTSLQLEQLQGQTAEGNARIAALAAQVADGEVNSALAANLTVRGMVDLGGQLGRIAETGTGTFDQVSAANAKLQQLTAGLDDGPTLSDIYDAADKAAKGGDGVCGSNCSGRGVCRFGACFASAQQTDDGFGTVATGIANVELALQNQGEMGELAAADMAGLKAKVGALEAGVEALNRETRRIRTVRRMRGMSQDFSLVIGDGDGEDAIEYVAAELAASNGLVAQVYTVADGAGGGRRGRRAARESERSRAKVERLNAEAAVQLAGARERLAAGDDFGALLSARAALALVDDGRDDMIVHATIDVTYQNAAQ